MKKLKRLIPIALVLATLLTSFSACGKNDDGIIGKKPLKFNKVYQEDLVVSFDEGYTAVEDVPFTEIIDYCGYFVSFTENNEYCIYNVKSNSVVLRVASNSIAKPEDVRLYDRFIHIVTTDRSTQAKTSSVYSADGMLLLSVDGDHVSSATEDGFSLQQKFHYVEDNAIKKEYSLPPFTTIDENYTVTNDYAIYIYNRTAIYYDEQFEIVVSYQVPSQAKTYKMCLLDNDNLLVQYALECDSNSKKFDFIMSGVKYQLHTFLLDPDKGRTKELNINVLINSVKNRHSTYVDPFTEQTFEDVYTDRVENVLSYYGTADGVLYSLETHEVLLGNDGKIGASLRYVEDQVGNITPLSTGYYYTYTKQGYVILNSKGERVHTVPDIGTATDFGYVCDKQVYNQDFELIFNVPVKNSSSISLNNTAIFYSVTENSTTKYYKYDKNGEHEITAPSGTSFYQYSPVSGRGNHYVVSVLPYSGGRQYYVYSMNDTLLFASAGASDGQYDAYTIYLTADNVMLIGYRDVETRTTVYKRLVG